MAIGDHVATEASENTATGTKRQRPVSNATLYNIAVSKVEMVFLSRVPWKLQHVKLHMKLIHRKASHRILAKSTEIRPVCAEQPTPIVQPSERRELPESIQFTVFVLSLYNKWPLVTSDQRKRRKRLEFLNGFHDNYWDKHSWSLDIAFEITAALELFHVCESFSSRFQILELPDCDSISPVPARIQLVAFSCETNIV
jgi:hypothetical protein